jgi:hypothetical protein
VRRTTFAEPLGLRSAIVALLLRLAVVARRRRALRRDFAQSGAALLAIRKRA